MKVAVVGSGISGLSAAWLLNRSEGFEVSLFEAADYLGGHSNTIDITLAGVSYPVDTGFLVHNPNTYPNLIAFFKMLEVEVVETDMSFSLRLDDLNLEWAGSDLTTVFAQKKNLFRPSFWKMILDILRFNKESLKNLELSRQHQWTLGELLARQNFSSQFRDWYLIPMGAAIWSTSTEEMLEFPAENFLQFCLNHSLLQVEGRPKWRTVKRGSREYVKKIANQLPRIYLNEAVTSVKREERVTIKTAMRTEQFDKVIFATHSDTTLKLIEDLTEEEEKILSKLRYQSNVAYLHTDESLLPRSKKVWSAWNYISQTDKLSKRAVGVSYLINKLQPLPFKESVIVSLNPPSLPEESKTLKVINYDHPVFDRDAIEAQALLSTIQGENHTFFAGAYCGYGFHEDGIKSAIDVTGMLGVSPPW